MTAVTSRKRTTQVRSRPCLIKQCTPWKSRRLEEEHFLGDRGYFNKAKSKDENGQSLLQDIPGSELQTKFSELCKKSCQQGNKMTGWERALSGLHNISVSEAGCDRSYMSWVGLGWDLAPFVPHSTPLHIHHPTGTAILLYLQNCWDRKNQIPGNQHFWYRTGVRSRNCCCHCTSFPAVSSSGWATGGSVCNVGTQARSPVLISSSMARLGRLLQISTPGCSLWLLSPVTPFIFLQECSLSVHRDLNWTWKYLQFCWSQRKISNQHHGYPFLLVDIGLKWLCKYKGSISISYYFQRDKANAKYFSVLIKSTGLL